MSGKNDSNRNEKSSGFPEGSRTVFFVLLDAHTINQFLHPLGTGLLHFFRHVTVAIQCEGGGEMLYHYNVHRQLIQILPMRIDILIQLRYNALWQY